MDTEPEQTISPDAYQIASDAAHIGRSQYRGVLPIQDAQQVALMWVLEHPTKVAELTEDGELGRRRLTGLISRAVEKAGRAERAYHEGYDPADEAFYNKGMIETLLPAVFDPDYRPWRDRDKSGRVHRDPSESGEWEAMVADVKRAWDGSDLTEDQEETLRLRFGDGWPTGKIAAYFNIQESAVRQRLGRGLGRMVVFLGGYDPSCPRDCECAPTIGNRTVKSSAWWRAQSDGYYTE